MSKSYKKINFRKSDFYRVLLTDTLPYEVPLPFSNDGFYTRIKKNSINRLADDIRKPFFELESFTIPYNYKIRKDADSDRSLSVVHPATQRRFCDFYARYDSLIIGLCSRSTFSIRRPKRVASRYFEKSLGFNASSVSVPSVETEHDGFGKQSKLASSYFSYHRYGLVHRFYDSMEFINIEKKFKYLRTLDISKCFHHIYTHTIAWSVKNKKYAKKYRGESFENQFDKLMQHSNYNETNGIVIGPEVSRIFAEVIFQKIDLRIKTTLTDLNLHEDREYVIRRYVDDFFVFSNDKDHLKMVEDIVSDALGEYKLYLNSSKTVNLDRPFTSSISAAKGDAAKLVERIFEQLCGIQAQSESSTSTAGTVVPLILTPTTTPSNATLSANTDLSINAAGAAEMSHAIAEISEVSPTTTAAASPIATTNLMLNAAASLAGASTPELFPRAGARWPKAIRSVDGLAVTYIKEIKNMVLSNEASFDNIATYLNSGILRRLDKMFRGASYGQCTEKSARHAADFLFFILKLQFFVLSMSTRVHSTHQIGKLILFVKTFIKDAPRDTSDTLKKYIFDDLILISKNIADHNRAGSVEACNIVILAKSLGELYDLSTKETCHIFGIDDRTTGSFKFPRESFGYFQIVTLIYYMGSGSAFNDLRQAVVEFVVDMLDKEDSIGTIGLRSDYVMLTMDLLRCPFLSQNQKNLIARTILKKRTLDKIHSRIADFITTAAEGDWFFSWEADSDLRSLLMKKELRPAY